MFLLLVVLLLCLCRSSSSFSVAAPKPHILFILQDDLGFYDVGFNNNTLSGATVTANISALARDGRLPIHHHEQLSGIATDDLDLRWTWISEKLKSAGYSCYWYGKGHTGYKSMKHLPINKGFDHFTGFLSGSQSYTSNDRWEDDHPMRTDKDMVNAPSRCTLPSIYTTDYSPLDKTCPKSVTILKDTKFVDCSGSTSTIPASSSEACCAVCNNDDGGKPSGNCSHWTFKSGECQMWSGRCTQSTDASATSGVDFHPRPGPNPPPTPPSPGDGKCHADSYSTTLYGEFVLQALNNHSSTEPFFLYFPIQAVHTPYDPVPFNHWGENYEGMLWDSDIYIGAIVNLLKSKNIYDNSVIVYTADNGGTVNGLNWPLRGEKHTNWEGGMRTAAFISGGMIPSDLRGTTSLLTCHVVDWYPTFSYLAGVDGSDDPPVPPDPVDPTDPTKDIYGNHSYPGVDGVNIWPMLIDPSSYNHSSAHEYLVLSKEVIISGKYKLLVGQNDGWDHSSDDGWKVPGPNGSWDGQKWVKPNVSFPCGLNDLPGGLMTLPGIPGQLPCLFDLEADWTEHTNLGSDPSNRDVLEHLWGILNHTVMTRYCRNVQLHSTSGCDRTPPQMLGNCNATCATNYWKAIGGDGASGPVCGVPGC